MYGKQTSFCCQKLHFRFDLHFSGLTYIENTTETVESVIMANIHVFPVALWNAYANIS